MAETFELMRVCTVGGNAVSAFLSWRLQATNACDVTLVWKSGFEAVSQYGISFRSASFGNERFKPRHGKSTPFRGLQVPALSTTCALTCQTACSCTNTRECIPIQRRCLRLRHTMHQGSSRYLRSCLCNRLCCHATAHMYPNQHNHLFGRRSCNRRAVPDQCCPVARFKCRTYATW